MRRRVRLASGWNTAFRRATALFALVLALGLAVPALAAAVPLSGNPLTVHVGDQGQLQAFRAGDSTGIFYAPAALDGDAGFFLAFPQGLPGDATARVYGFDGSAGPFGLTGYTTVSQSPTTGSGTPADPLRQVTRYDVKTGTTVQLQVTQTTTYVNGAQQFTVRWDVNNVSGSAVRLKALAAADFYFDGSDRGTGIYTDGPPRFIGGTNADTGNSGGFSEASGVGLVPWSAYQALEFGGNDTQVWGKVQHSATSSSASFDNTVIGESVDNAGGVEWDQYAVPAGIPAGQTRSFELAVKNAVPQALQLTPSNAGSPRGVPVNFTATATNTDGVPYTGRTLRYTITGVNPGGGSATLNGNGQATITDPGANAGADTVVAFVDFNNDGTRQDVEPQASSLATFVDNVPPSCKVKVSGDRPGGGGAGKPLVITVSCNEPATVKVATVLTLPRRVRRSSADAAASRRKKAVTIKLKTVTRTVGAGQKAPVKLKLPRSVRRKYAGKTLKATITVTVKDAAGNVKKIKTSKRIRLAKLKKGHR